MRSPIRSAGIFARLAAEAALSGLEPVALLALLKHPLLRLGLHETQTAVAALERAVLRGPRPRAGSAGLTRALATIRAQLDEFRRGKRGDIHPSDPRTGLTDSELDAAAELVARLAEALAPLETITDGHSFAEFAARHRQVLAALSRQDGAEAALSGPDGAKLGEALDELAASEAAAAPADREARLCRVVRRGLGRPRGAPATAPGHARAHPRAS